MNDSLIRLLVIESEQGLSPSVGALLEQLDLPVDIVRVMGPSEAEPNLRQSWADLLLLDLSPLEGPLLETVSRLLAAAPELPMIVLAGPRDEGLAEEALRMGAEGYLIEGEYGRRQLSRSIRCALERKRREIAHWRSESELLRRLIAGISQAEDLEGALRTLLEEVCRKTGWARGEAWIPNQSRAGLARGPVHPEAPRAFAYQGDRGTLAREMDEAHPETLRAFVDPNDPGLPGRVWASGEPSWIPDLTRGASLADRDVANRSGLRTGIGVPVLARGEVVAVLTFYHGEPRREDSALVRLVASVIANLGSLIERKRFEEESRRDGGRFRRVLSNSPVIVSTVDRDLRYTWLYNPNPNFPIEKVVGRRDDELASLDDVAELIALKREVLDAGVGTRREVRIAVGEQVRHYDVTAEPLKGSSGEVEEVMIVAYDVTECRSRELMEQLLADAGQLLGASLDPVETIQVIPSLAVPRVADWCVIDLLKDGEIEAVGIAATDPRKEELLRTMLSRYPHASGRPDHPIARVLRTGRSEIIPEISASLLREVAWDEGHLELMLGLAPRSAVIVPLTVHGSVIGVMTLTTSESGRVFERRDLASVEELGRRAGMAIDNARNHQQAKQALGIRDEVLGFVAHDLRNPLHAISLASAALAQMETLPETGRRLVETVHRSTEQIDRLIEDLLEVSRIESGHLRIELESCNLPPLISEAVYMVKGTAVGKRVRIDVEINADLPPVRADGARVLQILSNLLGNAIKFTAPGGRVTVLASHEDKEVKTSVADTGSGIRAEELPHVFDRFWQARRNRRGGAGLGLAIVRGLVEAQGGRVEARSRFGEGSTFAFTLPAAQER